MQEQMSYRYPVRETSWQDDTTEAIWYIMAEMVHTCPEDQGKKLAGTNSSKFGWLM